jgi:hypothetical protein
MDIPQGFIDPRQPKFTFSSEVCVAARDVPLELLRWKTNRWICALACGKPVQFLPLRVLCSLRPFAKTLAAWENSAMWFSSNDSEGTSLWFTFGQCQRWKTFNIFIGMKFSRIDNRLFNEWFSIAKPCRRRQNIRLKPKRIVELRSNIC